MQGKIELKNGAYTEYVSILSSILTPQCALHSDLEQALSATLIDIGGRSVPPKIELHGVGVYRRS